jgi:hypothetical protein
MLAAGFAGMVSIGAARADVVLSGPDANDGTYSSSSLAAAATASDTASSGTLTGISLWGLLGGSPASSPTSPIYGAITTSTPAGDNGKNAILRYYLVATGSSGTSVISLGEIDPSFGGTGTIPDFVAYQSTGGLLAAPELVVPGAPGRDVTGLTSLLLVAAPALPATPVAPGGPSTSVQLSGDVTNSGTYTLSALQSDFTPVTETVSGDTYTGVPIYSFLDPTTSFPASEIVVTQATDGYEVVYSLAELDPALGGNPADLLPYADTAGNFPADGVARTITPNDNAHGRWVSNLDAVEVTSVPEPGAAPLLAAAVVVLAWVRPTRQKFRD